MKFYIPFLLCCFSLTAQQADKQHNLNLVEAYYDKDTHVPLYVYDSINGHVVATYKNLNNKNFSYKIAITDSEYGWFKIESIQQIDNSLQYNEYKNHWVKSAHFLISVEESINNNGIYLYDEPDSNANKIHKLDQLQSVHIIETNCLWAMVRFKIGKKTITGWLNFENQSTCP